ncbi:MAG: ATP-binding protein [Caulobacteraceae bacterium]|nr:ATP-binding protein [Caulobacteraceae bacterium]
MARSTGTEGRIERVADQRPASQRLADVGALDLEALRPAFERIARLAHALSDAPIARVAILQGERVWRTGVGPRAATVINLSAVSELQGPSGATLWITDVKDSPRTRDNPYLKRSHVRFFASAPIMLSDGPQIGVLYLAGPEPRAPDPAVIERLGDLADLVAHECERPRLKRQAVAAEAEAGAAQTLLQTMVKAAPVAVAMINRQLEVDWVSPQWRQDMELQAIDMAGRCVFDMFPTARDQLLPALRDALAGGGEVRAQRQRLTLHNGARRWADMQMLSWRNGAGAISGVMVISHDVTDLVEALDASERAQQRLNLAAGIAGLHIWDIDYIRRDLNKEGAEDSFFDAPYTFEQLENDLFNFIHPDDRAGVVAELAACIAERRPFQAEGRVRRNDGKEVWAFGGAEAVFSEDGGLERVIGVLQNITARKEAERAIAKARDDAEAANQAKSEFLANMSHEIRTPLNGVLGIASALARTNLSREQRDMVGLIEASGQTLGNLLSDLLDLARIESGRMTLSHERFEMDAAVGPVAALFETTAVTKGLRFEVNLPQTARGAFAGDVGRIRQILSNLVSNAVKFTTEGRVRLGVEVQELETLCRCRFTVSDTGIGFDAATRDRLFSRFVQADASITRRFGGTGLGLSISRRLAEMMGGSLTAEGRPGVGAVFTLTRDLPRAAPETAAAPGEAPAWETDGGAPCSIRVLLAEDHPTNQKVVALILGAIGVELTSVENGQEAIEAFESQDFDVILMDMQMPVMDGLTAIRAIRAREAARRLPRTPIYALTANAMAEHHEASRAAGADAHLPNPITAKALIEAVRNAGRAQEREAERAVI